MKIHAVILASAVVLASSAFAQPDFGLVGWATAGTGTTGGSGGPTITVSDYPSFESALTQDGLRIVQVSGTITGTGDGIRVTPGKTVIGLGANARLENLGLVIGWNTAFGRTGNVIVRNLTFGSVHAPTDKIAVAYGAKNVWIDHCVFHSDLAAAGTNKDYYDGQLDITHGADFVTVSWCRFLDHYKNSLVGHTNKKTDQDGGHLTVTYHHNAFIHVNSRNPSVRYGLVHVFNNYYLNIESYGIASRCDAQVLVENNHFEHVAKPIVADTSLSKVAGFVRGAETNAFVQCGSNSIATPPSSWVPPYAYKLDPVADVPSLVMRWSGVGVLAPGAPLSGAAKPATAAPATR